MMVIRYSRNDQGCPSGVDGGQGTVGDHYSNSTHDDKVADRMCTFGG